MCDGEIGGRVVAKVFRVAEGEAGDVVVVGEPGEQRKQWEREGGDPADVLVTQ